MKRFVPVVLVLAVATALAASPAHAGLALGVKGGVSISQVQSDLFDTDNRTGFVGGVYGALDLTPMIGIQPELLFVRKGAKLFSTDVEVGGIPLGEIGTTLDVDYVEVPLLLRVSLPVADPLGVRLLAGPVASIKVNEKLSTTGLIGYSLDSDQVKTADFGIAAGAAVALRHGTFALVGEGRYTFGLTNISDLSIADVSFGGDVKNGSFYAMAGLEFLFGGR
jgi:hypothetical protein